jgi:hypothetical protein
MPDQPVNPRLERGSTAEGAPPTMVRVSEGETVMISGSTMGETSPRRTEVVVLVTPTIVAPAGRAGER